MRERTTWNRDSIKKATVDKTADPYTMNQDHAQPPADAYITGDPSSFAEDIHPNNWDVEFDGDGNTKRDEIGMPEKRPDTYNHPEKTASEEFLLKKSNLCVTVARMMLKGQKFASEDTLLKATEDQAVALMNLGDKELIDTHNRLAQGQQQDEKSDDDEQQKQAQGQQQDEKSDDDEQQKQAQGQQQQEGEQGSDDDQQKQASLDFATKVAEALQAGNTEAAQTAVNELVAHLNSTTVEAGAVKAQVADMIQNAMGTYAQQPQQMQDPMAMQDEEAMLDQMLTPQEAMPMPMQEGDIEMGMSEMDTGEVVLGSDDEVLRTLFAQDDDDEQKDDGQQQQKQAGVASASTATVGTKPTGGVSRIGGSTRVASTTAPDSNLQNLWATAPDVRDAFGLPKS